MSDHFSIPTSPPPEPAGLRGPSWFARHKVLTLLGIVVVLVIAVALAGGGGGTPQTTTTDQATSAAPGGATDGTSDEAAGGTGAQAVDEPAGPAQAGLGERVRDGALEFVVTAVKPGPALIGTPDFGVKPQGEFLLVTIEVTNIGREPATLFGDNQYLYAGERKFSADTEAAVYLDDTQTLAEEINPGNALTGVLVYDVPRGTTPTHIELHDSAFSGGVTVTLQ